MNPVSNPASFEIGFLPVLVKILDKLKLLYKKKMSS